MTSSEQTGQSDLVRVGLADGHPVVSAGLAAILQGDDELELSSHVENLEPASLVELDGTDLVLYDPTTLDVPSEEATEVIADALPTSRLVLYSSGPSPEAILASIAAGASGVIPKSVKPRRLISSIKAAAEGNVILTREMQDRVSAHIASKATEAILTPRERDVLRHTARGRTASQIGSALHISPTTVKSHLKSAYRKLGATNKASAVAAALRAGLIEDQPGSA